MAGGVLFCPALICRTNPHLFMLDLKILMPVFIQLNFTQVDLSSSMWVEACFKNRAVKTYSNALLTATFSNKLWSTGSINIPAG